MKPMTWSWPPHSHFSGSVWQTTEMYTRADPSVKLEALESVIAPKLRSGRFKATDNTDRLAEAALFYAERKTSKMICKRSL